MKSKISIFGAVAMALILTVPAVRASANTNSVDVTKSMQEARATAYQLSETADTLHSITNNGRLSWQTHSSYLESAREGVNQLGKMLANLEELKPNATQTQQLAIDRMRPQLVQTANSLTDAIELLNERRHHIYFPEYREKVQTVSEQATSMHQSLDAVLDYESAKARLDRLEMSVESGS